MATQANKLKVGVFLIAGFLLFNAALIWLGASRFFQESRTYVTYFEESVQGLAEGSPVKYRGVPLGRVSEIRLAPDGRLVEATMKLDPGFRVHPDMRAKLTSIGITGSAFIELGFPGAGVAAGPPPKLSFRPPPNYIPSRTSVLTDVLAALGNLVETIQSMDLPGLTEEYRAVAADTRELLRSPALRKTMDGVGPAFASVEKAAARARDLLADRRIDSFLEKMEDASESVAQTGRSARDLLGDPRLREAIGDAREAAREAKDVAAKLSGEAGSLRLGERLEPALSSVDRAARQASTTMEEAGADLKRALAQSDRAAKTAHAVVGDLGRSLESVLSRLTRAAALLESLTASLQREPSRLLLEGPPPEDFR